MNETEQLRRIAKYQLQNRTIVILFGIEALIVSFILSNGIDSDHLVVLLILGLPIIFGGLLGLAIKHQLKCPKCQQRFYGRFKVFLPYSPQCRSCGLSLRG